MFHTTKSRLASTYLLISLMGFLVASLLAVSACCTPAYAATAAESSNLDGHNYDVAFHPVKSHLEKTSSGYQRVEWTQNGGLVVEDYTDSFQLRASSTINASTYKPSDLPSGDAVLWGGYLATPGANYVVTGQNNLTENDNLKVLRVTKYSKSWKYLSNCEIDGINTIRPFQFGTVSILEHDGKLWIKTCHTMYKSSDGLNHQANMFFSIESSSMKLVAKNAYVASIGSTNWGYVSHSFNQLLTTANGSVYSLDHGDAYPRGFIGKQLADNDFGWYPFGTLMPFSGEIGLNYTGASVGGFSYSPTTDNLIAAVNSIDQAKFDSSETRNAYILTAKSDFSDTKTIALTSYTEGSSSATTPTLVKINDNKFLVAWQRITNNNRPAIDSTIYFQYIDGRGSKLSQVHSIPGYLSECQPILVGSKVVWYTTGKYEKDTWGFTVLEDTAPVFYTLDLGSNKVTEHKERTSLSKASITTGAKVYSGKALTPSITVKLDGKTLKKNVDYTVKCSNNRNVGKATVTITGKGQYKDSASANFKINPKGTSIKILTGSKKAITVKWKKQRTQTTGYQIRYSTSKNKDKNGMLKIGKTVKIGKSSTFSKKIKKLKGGKKYYVQIRTYKTVKGAKYYSSWSKPKTVKTKK